METKLELIRLLMREMLKSPYTPFPVKFCQLSCSDFSCFSGVQFKKKSLGPCRKAQNRILANLLFADDLDRLAQEAPE